MQLLRDCYADVATDEARFICATFIHVSDVSDDPDGIFACSHVSGYGPIAIADWSIIVQCHLLVQSLKWAY
jgi:hypothetical protein